jgi:hypothetical protein
VPTSECQFNFRHATGGACSCGLLREVDMGTTPCVIITRRGGSVRAAARGDTWYWKVCAVPVVLDHSTLSGYDRNCIS